MEIDVLEELRNQVDGLEITYDSNMRPILQSPDHVIHISQAQQKDDESYYVHNCHSIYTQDMLFMISHPGAPLWANDILTVKMGECLLELSGLRYP